MVEQWDALDARVRRVRPWLRLWHVLLVVAAVAAGAVVLFIVLAGPERVTCRGPAESIDSALVAQPVIGKRGHELASRVAPIFVFTDKEQFRPIPVDQYTQLTRPFIFSASGISPDRPFDGLITHVRKRRCKAACRYFRAIRPLSTFGVTSYAGLQHLVLDDAPRPIYYRVVAYRRPDSRFIQEYAVEYWLLYLYNKFPGDRHQADLEQVTIRARRPANAPFQAFYSTHVAGNVRNWKDIEVQNAHAVVYPAGGSHANYFATGLHSTLAKCNHVNPRSRNACIQLRGIGIHDYTDGCGEIWAPAGIDPAEPLSHDSCVRAGRSRAVLSPTHYDLEPWTPYAVDWGAPLRRQFLPPGWVDDPSLRSPIWRDPVAAMQAVGCYEKSAAAD